MNPFSRKRSSSESRVTSRRSKSSETADNTTKLPVAIGHCTLNTVEDNFHLYATLGKKKSLIKLLAKSKFPIDTPNCLGQSALFCAAYTGKEKVVEVLLLHGASPNFRCSGDYTPVHGSCWSCNVKILIMLLEAGGDLRARDTQERQPKDWCILQTNQEKGQFILQLINLLENIVATFVDSSVVKAQRNPQAQSSKVWEQLLNYVQKVARKSCTSTPSLPDFPSNFAHFLGHGNICIDSNNQLCNLSYIQHVAENNLRMSVTTGKYYTEASMVMERMEWNSSRVTRKRIKENCSHCMMDVLMLELDHLSQLRHSNLLLLMGVCPLAEFKQTSLVFENVEIGSLYHILHEKHMSPNHSKCQEILLQICDALVYLHSKLFVHCAVTSHSIHLVTASVAKLGNCGYMVQCRPDGVGCRKTLDMIHFQDLYHWLAPEIISDDKPTVASDVYGLASVLLEMLTIRLPWANLSSEQIAHCLLRKNIQPELPPYVVEPFDTVLCEGLRIPVSARFVVQRESLTLPPKTSFSADSLAIQHMEGPSPTLKPDSSGESKQDMEEFGKGEQIATAKKTWDVKLHRGQTLPRLNLRQETPRRPLLKDDTYSFIQNPDKRRFFQSSTLPQKDVCGRFNVTPRPQEENKCNMKAFDLSLTPLKICRPTLSQSAREIASPRETKRNASIGSLHISQPPIRQAQHMMMSTPIPDGRKPEKVYRSANRSAGSQCDSSSTNNGAVSVKPASHHVGTSFGSNVIKMTDGDGEGVPFSSSPGSDSLEVQPSMPTSPNASRIKPLSPALEDWFAGRGSVQGLISSFEKNRTIGDKAGKWGSCKSLISSCEKKLRSQAISSLKPSEKSKTLPINHKSNSFVIERRQSLGAEYGDLEISVTSSTPTKQKELVNSGKQEKVAIGNNTAKNSLVDAPVEDLYFDDELNECNCEDHLRLLASGVEKPNQMFAAKITPVFNNQSPHQKIAIDTDESNISTPRSISDVQLEADTKVKVIQVKAEPGYSCTVRTESNSLGDGTHHVTLTKTHMQSGKEEIIEEVIHADVVQHHIIMEK
uniref:Protein kinase domain-containing protein n=1 Tax=Strigamia maritima TaxID=126957 RepID=T1IH24_STRMM